MQDRQEAGNVRPKLDRNLYFKKQPDGSERHETQILGDWAVEFLKKSLYRQRCFWR